ncbi:MAG TPA: ABC transporter ATP-binding protein [Candidatus Acidoferrales bacterium]|jgi:NitT/TauT family transport system ATP-binding protein|nr:ABC transporter ATP-binding protein [Candidatus Acidoferrales bacterium]
MPLIEIRNACVAYGTPLRPVLEGIDLCIDEGEFVCVLGQTGCGKSTLLRLVLGSEKPMRGQVLVDGRVHEQPDRSRGYVPQKYSLFPDKTVLDNITFGPEVSEFNLLGRLTPRFYRRRQEFRREALEYLRRIGLQESDAGKYPDQLSGGMQQRVAIAQALITQPRILLMDEAFSALDSTTRRGMQHLLRQLWRNTGATILFVTHNAQEALSLGTRLIVLARESAASASRIVLDMAVPEPGGQQDVPQLVRRLERAATFSADPAEALSEQW